MKGRMEKLSYGRNTHTQIYLFQYYTMVPLEVASTNATFVVSILIVMAVVVGHAAPMLMTGQRE